ncbi:TonB-dependent receptor domain-containing protein [Rufibacter sediminis]|uniref:TonB-dependent receptor n=1 Tax=Rufibacter sediminis TaxID=2762756 RepID=A0ABR6VYG0_9BACT|nr:outer membrane beta-barrel family protein [Rufibacter sediminis]MBC3542189.1 TonB-dependent receptor [Rufibacter sediminis]
MRNVLLLATAGVLAAHITLAQTPQNRPAPAPAPTVAPQTAPKGNGKISGVVLDETGRKPVEFATISLVEKSSGKTVDGTVTDYKGKFSLVRVAAGQYRLSISFLGYETSVVDNISLGNKDEVNIGVVSLKGGAKKLEEVAVVGDKLLIEDKVDRLVYNAEKDLTNVGGTASDVLKKVPGLTVDLEGNVALRGSSNLRVLINNKPSAVMATSLADALQQIPSDQIKSVEVITSPSAKYDAEGTAGIINIITKKNSLQGLNGNVSGSYGTRLSNLTGNVNYRKGKIGVNTAFGQNWRNNPMESTRETVYSGIPGIDRLSQTMEGKREGEFQMLQVGVDYELSKKSSLAAGLRMQSGEFAYITTQTSSSYLGGEMTRRNTRFNRNEFDALNYDLNLDFSRQFAKPGQELSVLGLLSRSNRENFSFAEVYNRDQQLALREQNLNDAFNMEKTLQVDYSHPFKNKHVLEVGTKAILRSAESDYQFMVAEPASAPFLKIPSRSDVFAYDQNVGAAYASYEFSLLKKYNFKLGTRYEHTKVDGDFRSTETSVKQHYNNFIPNVAISRALKNNQTVKFNYTKRIQRPQLGLLNPFENRTDTFNIQVGNPNLRAEITHAYELGYSAFSKSGTSVNATLFWRQTNNSIEAYTLPNQEGVNYTRFGNIGRNASYGANVFASTKFLEKGNVSGNLNVYQLDLESRTSELNATNSSLMFHANLNASYAFNKGISAQLFSLYNSRRVTLQGKASAFAMYSFAVKKDILQKNGSISVGVENPFSASLKQRTTFQTASAEQVSTQYMYNRQVRISANYKFGKMASAKNQPKRKKKINNDDAKSDGDSNG